MFCQLPFPKFICEYFFGKMILVHSSNGMKLWQRNFTFTDIKSLLSANGPITKVVFPVLVINYFKKCPLYFRQSGTFVLKILSNQNFPATKSGTAEDFKGGKNERTYTIFCTS